MKIAYTGLNLPQGKVKYDDPIFTDLVEKFQPVKVSPYYFEFLPESYEWADVIAVASENILDLLILDMDKIEVRLSRTDDTFEREVLEKCLEQLNGEKPLCGLNLDPDQRVVAKALKLMSLKPTLIYNDASTDANAVCRDGLEKSGRMFFYTVGKEEVHAWLVVKGNDAATCAGAIHSDLARGFIKAELLSYEDMMTAHNFQDARTKNLVKLVNHDYIVPMNSILDIRFKV